MPRTVTAIIILLLLGMRSARAQSVTVSDPFLGVKHYAITLTSPRPNNVQVVEIDLATAGLKFCMSPRDPGLPNGDETITQTTRQFVDEQSAQIGINTSFFRLDNGGLALPTNNNGIAASEGDGYSPWDSTGQVGLNIDPANVATIITAPSVRPTGFETSPAVNLYNATAGSNRLVSAGANVAPADSTTPGAFLNLNPRTAVGITATSKLLLATIDGRRAGFSEGMYLREVADLLISYGAVNAINLDGGGSTTMAFDYYADGATRSQLVNVPSGSSERYVGQSLAVFAPRNPAFVPPGGTVNIPPPPGNIRLLEDFEDSNGTFFNDPDFSGSNHGLLEVTDGNGPSSASRDANQHGRGFASQKISIVSFDDPTWTGFRLRHLSGQGNPANNQHLGVTGFVGAWLKTSTPELQIAMGLDENLTAALELSVAQEVIADGAWHLYQWNLADAAQWDSFSAGNGQIDGPVTTLDSIFISSLVDQNAVVWIDAVAYNPDGSLAAVVPEPAGALAALVVVLRSIVIRRR